MILAIGVAAIVLITVNTVLFAALRLHEATAETVDAASPVDAAVTFLRRDLQCVACGETPSLHDLSAHARAV